MDATYKVIKGRLFEDTVGYCIKAALGGNCKILRNYKTYSIDINRNTEIDLIVITKFKLYVIEAKSFNTSIEGNYNDMMWIGRSGRYTTRLFSPFIQNNVHTRKVRSILRGEVTPRRIESCMCFKNNCIIDSNCENAYSLTRLIEKIKKDSRQLDHIINMENSYNILKEMEVII